MSRVNFWQKIKKPRLRGATARQAILALAPMAGVTDSAFRQICREEGADVVYTEMISADGLFFDSPKTLTMLKFDKRERPIVVQLFGKHPERFVKAAQICEAAGFDGIDINFGCPAKKVAGHGGGVTLMRDLSKCRQIIEAVLSGAKLPVSVKLRSAIHVPLIRGESEGGKSDNSGFTPPALRAASPYKGEAGIVTALDFIRYMKDLPLAAVMIHGRPYERPFDAEIDFSMIKKVKQEFGGIVLGNGGIKTPEDAVNMLEKTSCDGFGLARGVYGRPGLFGQIRDYLKKGKYKPFGPKEIIKVAVHHAKLAESAKGKHGLVEMRKHLLWYVSGWPQAKELRSRLVRVENIKEIKRILTNL